MGTAIQYHHESFIGGMIDVWSIQELLSPLRRPFLIAQVQHPEAFQNWCRLFGKLSIRETASITLAELSSYVRNVYRPYTWCRPEAKGELDSISMDKNCGISLIPASLCEAERSVQHPDRL